MTSCPSNAGRVEELSSTGGEGAAAPWESKAPSGVVAGMSVRYQQPAGTARASFGSWAPARVVLIVVHGASVATGAYLLSRLAGGMVEGGAFLLAVLMAAVTLGLAIASAVNGAQDRLPRPPSAAPRRRSTRCHGCHRPLLPLHGAWVCPTCDGIPASPSSD
jgi:hypothetical protein